MSGGPQPNRLRRDARDNVARLTAAALAVFTERGLGARLDEIARRAGVSQGTLYNRFGGREGLIDAVLPDMVASRLDELERHARAAADPGERFERYVTGLCELQASCPALTDVMSQRFVASREVETLCERTLAVASDLIADALATGALRPDVTGNDLRLLLVANAAVLRELGTAAWASGGAGDTGWRRMAALFVHGTRAR